MYLLVATSTFLCSVFLVFASILPYLGLKYNCLPSFKIQSVGGLSLCNCLACGIFLATCFLGLIPHVTMNEQHIRQYLDSLKNTSQSLSPSSNIYALVNTNLVILIGFLLILLVEQSVFLCSKAKTGSNNERNDARYTVAKNHRGNSNKKLTGNEGSNSGQANLRFSDHEIAQPLVIDDDLGESSDSGSDVEWMDQIEFRTHGHSHEHSQHVGHAHHTLPTDGSFFEMFLLLFALSIHSIFEGVALGAQQDNTNKFLKFLLSVMLHEVLCSFAYGVNLANQRVSTKAAFLSILFLSFSIPLGMILMAMVGAFEQLTSMMIRFVLEGFAAGIFIYVSCIELLASEISHEPSKSGLVKALFVVLGAVIFYILNTLLSD